MDGGRKRRVYMELLLYDMKMWHTKGWTGTLLKRALTHRLKQTEFCTICLYPTTRRWNEGRCGVTERGYIRSTN